MLASVAEKVEPWIPVWLYYALGIPFTIITIVLAVGEWCIRMLVTPKKFLPRG